MVTNKGSAEIYEFDNARARLRGERLDLSRFPNTGEFLKAVREESGQGVEAFSARTHIKAEYLEAIETMTLDNLPSRPFAIGFVKGYAEALGLDAAPVVERFKEDAGFSSASESVAETIKAAPAPSVAEERPEMSLLAVIGVVVFILWCGWQITRPKEIAAPLNLSGFPAASEPLSGAAIMDPRIAAQRPSAFETGDIPDLPAVIEARIIDRIEPVYPPRCEAGARPDETVTVSFTITAKGGVSSERIAASSNECFNRASLNAVRRWRFVPRTVDGVRRPAFEQRFTFPFDRPS